MKTFYKCIGRCLPSLFFMLVAITGNAQNLGQIKLLDQDTHFPIEGAFYQYGDKTGTSDSEGRINIAYSDNLELLLSHLSYGQWTLSPEEVKQAINEGQILKVEEVIIVQPVTILALHSLNKSLESINIQHQDRLAHDAGDILRQTPVISGIRKSGNYGFDPVLRGFKYEQINIVIDGAQSAIAACPNRMDPPTSQVAPNMIDEVEVIKGPHSLRYGTTFGGAINFITSKPSFNGDNNLYGRLTGAYESNGKITRTEGLVGFKGSKYDMGVFGSYSIGDDYNDGDGNTVPASFSRNSLGAVLGLKISENQSISLSATHNVANDVIFPALPMDLRSDDTWLFNAKHSIQLDGNLKSWNTTVFGSMVDHKMDNLLKNMDPRMANATTEAQTSAYGARTEGVLKIGGNRLFVGADYRSESAKGTRQRDFLMGPMAGNTVNDNVWQDGQINKTGVFSEYHLHMGSVKFVASGRLEINNGKITNADPEFESIYSDETSITQINPGISLGAVKYFNNGFQTGLWLGRAQRSGSLAERYINSFPIGVDPYEIIGNPAVEPEVNNQVDLTIGYLRTKTNIELSAFGSYLQHYISSEIRSDLSPTIPSSPGVRQVINLEKASMIGFEVSWAQLLVAGLSHNFNVAYTKGYNSVDDEPLPEIAPLDMRYSLIGNYLDGKLKPELTFRYVAAQNRIATSYGENSSPSFNLLDIKVEYQVIEPLKAVIGINNLLDAAYFEHLTRSVRGTPDAIMAPGRNIFIMLTLDLM